MTTSAEPPNTPPSRWWLWFWGMACTTLGVLAFTLVATSTREFWSVAVFGLLVFGLPVAACCTVILSAIFLATHFLISRRPLSRRIQQLLLLGPGLLAGAIFLLSAIASASAAKRFEAIVLRPVPEGVSDIHAAGLSSFLTRLWFLSFKMPLRDVDAIISKHSLAPSAPFELQEVIDRDNFLRRVVWARNVDCPTNALFFSRHGSNAIPSTWTFLIIETNSSRAWFLTSYQN